MTAVVDERTEITRSAADIALILELTLAGWDTKSISKRARMKLIPAIQAAHGGTDQDQMRRMLTHLRRLGDLDVTFDLDVRPGEYGCARCGFVAVSEKGLAVHNAHKHQRPTTRTGPAR